jgi:hypothetical protein
MIFKSLCHPRASRRNNRLSKILHGYPLLFAECCVNGCIDHNCHCMHTVARLRYMLNAYSTPSKDACIHLKHLWGTMEERTQQVIQCVI